jgi:uncharacterized repeat protein (TIGR03803 family)
MLVTAVIGTPAAEAQTYTVLYKFLGGQNDGAGPGYGTLIGDSAGNLYGTTEGGGASGAGVVFKLDKTGETVLYSFKASPTDGGMPMAGLIRDSAGNLYGTTTAGGASDQGTVFKLDPIGTETVLYSFTGGGDGGRPYAGLIQDSAGNLYGTTTTGGVSGGCDGPGCGVVFKLDTTGTETVLHAFTGRADGGNPRAGLILDSAGNLYGTTAWGGVPGCHGTGCGLIFKLDTTGTETVLHDFTGADGAMPYAGLILDSAGNLYGTTVHGGAWNEGVVFKLDTTGTETVVHSFNGGSAGGSDGATPYAGLIRDPAGNLYGTTESGGGSSGCNGFGCGAVFKLDTTGTETVLYSFTEEADGANPLAGLSQDPAGNLYGTASEGGTSNDGVVFKLQP